MSRLPVDVAISGTGGVQLRCADADSSWEVIEAVCKELDYSTFDEICAAQKDRDGYALDRIRGDVGRLPIKLLHLSKQEALALAYALLAVVGERVSA